jgi:hypothetical protein
MAKVREHTDGGFTQWDFKCPGCGHNHVFVTAGPSTSPHNQRWQFNGNVDKPTFTPSLLNWWGKDADPNWQEPEGTPPSYGWSGTCHLYVTAGQIQYLGDCTHKLAGQTIDMVDL